MPVERHPLCIECSGFMGGAMLFGSKIQTLLILTSRWMAEREDNSA